MVRQRPPGSDGTGEPDGGHHLPDPGPSVLRDCADAETHVGLVCFKIGPPRLLGVELEWLLHHPHHPDRPLDPASLIAALGPHTPTSLDPASPARPLPSGSTVTVEPGGQIELASPPLPTLPALLAAVTADTAALHGLLAAQDLTPLPVAADPHRPARRLLQLPRYRAMEQAFDRHGPWGRSGMCSTAAVQVCLDVGEGPDVAARWDAVHAVGPALLGAFANSPSMHGRATGWKSSRWLAWQRADPARTAPPTDTAGADPVAGWARRVLDSPVLCVRDRTGHGDGHGTSDGAATVPGATGDGVAWETPDALRFVDWICGARPAPPTVADLDYHVSTLFPPVRAQGHLEVRYCDAQPDRRWALPIAVLTALLADPDTRTRAVAACAPVRQHWTEAARHGLADPALCAAATVLFELAAVVLPRLDAPDWVLADLADMTDRQVRRGRCPADDVVDADRATPTSTTSGTTTDTAVVTGGITDLDIGAAAAGSPTLPAAPAVPHEERA